MGTRKSGGHLLPWSVVSWSERMNLQLQMQFAEGYKNPSQVVRRVTEPRGADNLYCCACTSDRLNPQATNTRVSDFLCPECVERYQLKSHKGTLGRCILGSD